MNHTTVLDKLLSLLWVDYAKRVAYARQYQALVEQLGGLVQNDHMAFRTFNTNCGAQPKGVEAVARVFTSLGYQQKDKYLFPDKKLTAWHYEHSTNPQNPKIFISQLEVDQLSPSAAEAIQKSVSESPDFISSGDRKLLASLATDQPISNGSADILASNLAKFFSRPWTPPERSVVEQVDKESQYAAWTLLHGNSVNHFTAYINEQNVKEWPDLETTVDALRQAGIPMKETLEGEKGSRLRQSSTRAADSLCDVVDSNGLPGKLLWSYAYYELAERGDICGVDGKPQRFQGFLGAQATNLFDMTKRS